MQQQEREAKQSDTALVSIMGDKKDDKVIKEEENEALMDRFQRLLQKHEECLQDKERMNTQLDEQHSLLRSMAQSMQITPTTTSETAGK